ncbi:GntR family transcriptional regulator [Liquorilactobacillus sp.]|uniref:GntR family transcriptional regulator n=1 Tax=Liquorilactobacillus sp. TaxID=2767923 RepID=UPI0039E7BA99
MAVPKYKFIEDDIKKKIISGIYPKGSIIPKEMILVSQYNVSRPTIRQAIQNLVNEGLLEKKRHRGTMVRQNKISQEFTHVIESYDSEMQSKGLTAKTQVIVFRNENPTPEVAEKLGLDADSLVYKLVRLRFAGTEPVVLVTTFLPYELLNNFDKIDFTKHSLYDELAKCGYPITHVRRKLEVIAAGETTSTLLNVKIAEPLFYFHTIGDTNGQKIEYSIAKYRGDINYFMFDIDKSDTTRDLRI